MIFYWAVFQLCCIYCKNKHNRMLTTFAAVHFLLSVTLLVNFFILIILFVSLVLRLFLSISFVVLLVRHSPSSTSLATSFHYIILNWILPSDGNITTHIQWVKEMASIQRKRGRKNAQKSLLIEMLWAK